MVDQEILGDTGVFLPVLVHKLHPYQFIQAILEITQKNFAAFTGKQPKDIIVIFLKMLEKMAEDRSILAPPIKYDISLRKY